MLKKRSVAVFGVVYPKMRCFADDYFSSLHRQTYKDFDLVIVNNGFKNLSGYVRDNYSLCLREINSALTIPKIRELGINYLRKEGYKYIIFTDSDDFFAPNRIETTLMLLNKFDIVVNDFTTVLSKDKFIKARYLSQRIRNASEIKESFVFDKNVFGFSNTSIRGSCLTSAIKFSEALVAVDWYFFACLLREGHKAVFTNKTLTYYRIYEGNTAGVSPGFSVEKLMKSIDIKSLHYRMLYKRFGGKYKKAADGFLRLKKQMKKNGYRLEYFKKSESLPVKNPFWWEDARLLEELQ
jgi:glycosyltransferase involved in cell wall biosynthesis